MNKQYKNEKKKKSIDTYVDAFNFLVFKLQ